MSPNTAQLFALTAIALLLSAMVLTLSPASGQLNLVSESITIPQTDQEYKRTPPNNALQSLVQLDEHFKHTILTEYTTPEYTFPVPIANIIGQHFSLEDGTQIFIASALSELEVYHDLNGDGIPQTSTGSDENEILYYIYSNMSESYSMTPIQKTTIDAVPHYQWSFTYQNAYAYLQNAQARVGVVARMFFEHLTLNYDFSVNGNVLI